MRITFVFLILLCGCISKKVVLSPDNTKLTDQQEGFILGLYPAQVMVNKVTYNMVNKTYTIAGWIDDINWNNNGHIRYDVYRISETDTSY
jgi:hypothetical protein